MKAPTITRIIPSAAYPKWFNGCLSAINSFLIQVNSGLNKNLTFDENMVCQFYPLNLTTLSTYSAGDFNTVKFTKDFKNKASGLFILQIAETGQSPSIIKSAVSVQWEAINGYIYVNYISGLEDSKSYAVSLLLI